MPETLLLLEFVAHEPAVDLSIMTQLVLDDLGATVQILRLAGREYGNASGRPQRIEDCISDLGVDRCLTAVSERTVARDSCHNAIAETWAHSREIAHYCKAIADELPGLNPNEGYLVGLLHTIGSLPAVLGWDGAEAGVAIEAANGLEMAKRWSLPSPVADFFAEMNLSGRGTRWSDIVAAAHQHATRSSTKCHFEKEVGPLLLASV